MRVEKYVELFVITRGMQFKKNCIELNVVTGTHLIPPLQGAYVVPRFAFRSNSMLSIF
jgi:hypothetical protein